MSTHRLNNACSFSYTSADKTVINGVCKTARSGYGLGRFLSSSVIRTSCVCKSLTVLSDDSQLGVVDDVKRAEAS